MSDRRPTLPNSPLAEVTCELRFHGDLSLFSAWGSIQSELRGSFPQLWLEGAAPRTSGLLQPMRLVSDDGFRTVLLAINSVAFSTRKYTHFEEFLAQAAEVIGCFKRCSPRHAWSRVGLRYVNFLPPVLPNPAKGLVHPCLRLSLGGWPKVDSVPAEQPQMVLAVSDGDLCLRVAVLAPQGPAFPAQERLRYPASSGVQFDLDAYALNPPIDFDDRDFLIRGHKMIDDAFFHLITDDYLKYLKGE